MKRAHAFLAAGVIGVAAATGTVAVTRTTDAQVSAARPVQLPTAEVVRRQRALDRLERQIKAALRARTPALPKLPHYAPVAVPTDPPRSREAPAVDRPAAPTPATPVAVSAPSVPPPAPAAPVAALPAPVAAPTRPPQPAPTVAIVAMKPVVTTRTSPHGSEQGDDDRGGLSDEAYEHGDSDASLAGAHEGSDE